jgi:hypothetical protein
MHISQSQHAEETGRYYINNKIIEYKIFVEGSGHRSDDNIKINRSCTD